MSVSLMLYSATSLWSFTKVINFIQIKFLLTILYATWAPVYFNRTISGVAYSIKTLQYICIIITSLKFTMYTLSGRLP